MGIKEASSGHINRRQLLLRGSQGLAGLFTLYALSQGVPWLLEATAKPTNSELLAKFYPEGAGDHFSLANFIHNRTKVRLYDAGDRIDPRAFEEMYRFVASIRREPLSFSYMGHPIGATTTQADQDYYLFFSGGQDSQRPQWVRDGSSDTVKGRLRFSDITASFAPFSYYPEETVSEELVRGLFDLRFGKDLPAELRGLFSDITAMSFGAGFAMKQGGLSYGAYKEGMSAVNYVDLSTQQNHPSVVFTESLYESIPSITLTKS